MGYPANRPRRLRENDKIRNMVRETNLTLQDLIYPIFVNAGKNIKEPVPSMPGVYQLSIDYALEEVSEVEELKIPAVLLFGIPEKKDAFGSEAYQEEGVVQRAVRSIKEKHPDLYIITDVCLCGYTDHGHCGVVKEGRVLNDPTLELLGKIALSHARAGVDMVAPSDMMDGRIGFIRSLLDANDLQETAIMSYTAKYSSSFYGPFREAAHSSPQFGDRNSYQMDPANTKEAVKEAELDIGEGADILMVKPALPYLDIIKLLKDKFNYPIAAYNVSGEYAAIKAAVEKGWLDEKKVVLEMLTGIKRAGADMILTYFAKDAAVWLQSSK